MIIKNQHEDQSIYYRIESSWALLKFSRAVVLVFPSIYYRIERQYCSASFTLLSLALSIYYRIERDKNEINALLTLLGRSTIELKDQIVSLVIGAFVAASIYYRIERLGNKARADPRLDHVDLL